MTDLFLFEQLKSQTEFRLNLAFSNLKIEMDLCLDFDYCLFIYWQCAFSVKSQFAILSDI